MDRCSYCGHELRPQARYCSGCGKERVQAKTSDSAGIVPQTNGVSPISDIYKQAVMNPRLMFRPNIAPTTILKEPVEPAPSLEETSHRIPALPMDDAVPSTPPPAPSPEEINNHAPALPIDVSAPDIISLPEEAGDHAPAHLANGDVPHTPLPEELVSASPALLEEVSNADDVPVPAASPDAPSPYEAIFDAIGHLSDFLDKNKKEDNDRNIENVRQHKSDGKVLIGMCLHICRQVIEVYKNRQTERYLSQDKFKSVFVLAHFALEKSEEELKSATERPAQQKAESYLGNAKKYSCVLDVIYELRYGKPTPSAILRRVRKQYRGETGGPAAALLWQEIARIVSSYLREQGQAQKLVPDIPEMARQWIEAFSYIDTVDEEAYKTLSDAVQQYVPEDLNPLSFLTKVEQASLLDHRHNLRFEQIGTLLPDKQTALLQALCEALYDPGFGQALPPRRSIPMVYRQVELIPWIKELLARPDERAPEQALHLLNRVYESGVHIKAEDAPVLREWYLYVKARARGLLAVVDQWQADVNQDAASWEEIWNMAAAFHEKFMANSLKVLLPGVKSQRAPFSHLRFALYCAAAILQRKEKYLKDSVTLAETFLWENLWKLPLPLAYLTWLALANEVPEALDYQQHLSKFTVFQHLLDHSITYTYAAHPAHEISIEDYERHFQELLLLAQKLERDYVLVSPQQSITLKSKMLGTSFHISYNAARSSTRKRVGIFVDYENLFLSLPREMQNQSEMIAETLSEYASQHGEVVSSWICYAPANVYNESVVANKFQKAGFKLEVPRGVEGNLKPRENQADYVLLECITSAMIESQLDVYIIVSGDHFYYERVRRLLEKGHSVAIVSYMGAEEGAEKRLSDKYVTLQKNRAFLPQEHGEFTIDNLWDIFHFTPAQVTALDAEIEKRHGEKNTKG